MVEHDVAAMESFSSVNGEQGSQDGPEPHRLDFTRSRDDQSHGPEVPLARRNETTTRNAEKLEEDIVNWTGLWVNSRTTINLSCLPSRIARYVPPFPRPLSLPSIVKPRQHLRRGNSRNRITETKTRIVQSQ